MKPSGHRLFNCVCKSAFMSSWVLVFIYLFWKAISIRSSSLPHKANPPFKAPPDVRFKAPPTTGCATSTNAVGAAAIGAVVPNILDSRIFTEWVPGEPPSVSPAAPRLALASAPPIQFKAHACNWNVVGNAFGDFLWKYGQTYELQHKEPKIWKCYVYKYGMVIFPNICNGAYQGHCVNHFLIISSCISDFMGFWFDLLCAYLFP